MDCRQRDGPSLSVRSPRFLDSSLTYLSRRFMIQPAKTRLVRDTKHHDNFGNVLTPSVLVVGPLGSYRGSASSQEVTPFGLNVAPQ